MTFNQENYEDLRDVFCFAVSKVFGNAAAFIDFLEDEKYSEKYDCFLNSDGENYIINRETGEFINWYKLNHIGRCINISIFMCKDSIPNWIENFLVEFKGE